MRIWGAGDRHRASGSMRERELHIRTGFPRRGSHVPPRRPLSLHLRPNWRKLACPWPALLGRAPSNRGPQRSPRDQYAGAVHMRQNRSEEHTSELQSLMRISYAVFCLKKKKKKNKTHTKTRLNIEQTKHTTIEQ